MGVMTVLRVPPQRWVLHPPHHAPGPGPRAPTSLAPVREAT